MGGLLMVVGYLIFYFIDATLLASFLLLFLYAFPLYFMVYGSITYRKENKGYKSYGEAFVVVFIIAITAALIIDWFGFLLYKVIDPSLVEIIKEATIEKSAALYEKMNLPEDQIEKQMRVLKYTDFSPTLKTQGIRMISSTVVSLVLSALIALFVRRNENTNNSFA